MSELKITLSHYWDKIQKALFPYLEDALDNPLSERLLNLIAILDMVRIERLVFDFRGYVGRPPKNRLAIARAFIAKTVFNIPTTKLLIDRLKSDKNLRRVCGFESSLQIPSESAFSRAFQEFAQSDLPGKAHEALIKTVYKNKITQHVSIDSTAIEGREGAVKKVKVVKEKKKKRAARGCAELTRIEKQAAGIMSLDEMLKDLPTPCDVGQKTSSTGHSYAWVGYKLHLSVDDYGVPLAGILSSASMNDTQAAIPLAKLTAERVTSLYDLMDSGYYANAIIEHSKALGHVPIIEIAAKGEAQKKEKEAEKLARKNLRWMPAEAVRYRTRTTIERTNARLKDEFGAFNIRVKGACKVFAHLMYGVLAQTADQLLKLAT